MKNIFNSLGKDLPAGIVVFLVALPLCLGIALASGAPLFAGVIAGIVGGVVVGSLSGSSLGVSGPAAGLTVIVLNAIKDIGAYESFLLAVVLAGCFQIILSLIGAGKIAYYFPSSVIKGMLSAIGILIILKQIPHALGVDKDFEGDESFFQRDGENTFSELIKSFDIFNEGALIIGVASLLTIIFWEKIATKIKALSVIPAALLAVLLGVIVNQFYPENLKIQTEHLVNLPVADSISGFIDFFRFPNFGAINNLLIWKTAVVLAIIASLETLLCVEATDRLDPEKSITPTNRELMAQGAGNIVSGLLGGLPVTQVIVRSSANIQAGGKTKLSAIFHGLLLLGCAIFIPTILNKIPLAALAAVLLTVGYKLTKPAIFKAMYKEGQDQFIPFIVTVLAIVFTDLLTGILIGLMIGIGYVLATNFRSALKFEREVNSVKITFNKDIFFFNRAELVNVLNLIKPGDSVFIDGQKAKFIDHDIFLTLQDFVTEEAPTKNINVEMNDINRSKINFKKTKEKN